MNLKSLRIDKLKMSEEEFSEAIGIDLSRLREWEDDGNPSFDTLPYIQQIAQKTGMDFNEILSYEKPKVKAFDAQYRWEKADFTKKSFIDYIDGTLNNKDVYISEEYRQKYLVNLQQGIDAILVKPSISIVGRSDTGKSTLINALIGMDKMPTSWTPTTSIAVYIKHINDRPPFIKEDAWVFTNEKDGEELWNVKRLYDEEYCKKWRIAAGEVDILRKFGTRQGGSKEDAGSAIVFIDAPILLNCDIVDLPGFGTETESDDIITFKAAQRTDILIYLSQANGFMRIEDITYLKENVRNLPIWEKKGDNALDILSNLFVVASQAHTVGNGNERELKNILERGYENFNKTLSSGYWDKRKKESGYGIAHKDVLARFFTYTTDIPSLCERFEVELKSIIEQLPDIINDKAKKFVRDYVSNRRPNLTAEVKKFEEIVEQREKYVMLLKEIEDQELDRAKENERYKKEIREFINRSSNESEREFSAYCAETIDMDALVRRIKDKKIKNKKGEIECFASLLQDEIQEECNRILENKAKLLSEEIKKYIAKYDAGIKAAFDRSSVDVDFDPGFAFASAIAKIGIIGGLGAYIAGEAAFWLGSIGFIMGVGGDIALGAASFGPIGLAVGLVIATGIGFVKLFGGGWEKSVAKKLVKSYEENNVTGKYREGIKKYWNDAEEAFNEASRKLDEGWDDYVKQLKDIVDNYNVDDINNKIASLNVLMIFFDNIPL